VITLTREEAQQLLEVFELFLEEAEDVTTLENNLVKMLRTRIAQPEPETCGYDETTGNCTQNPCCYPASPQLEPSVEPVADKYLMEVECTKCGAKQDGILTVNAPPQREWQGLTDEEIMSLLPGAVRLPPGWSETVRAIEAKLKEKNA